MPINAFFSMLPSPISHFPIVQMPEIEIDLRFSVAAIDAFSSSDAFRKKSATASVFAFF
jgi:hypothetical protein